MSGSFKHHVEEESGLVVRQLTGGSDVQEPTIIEVGPAPYKRPANGSSDDLSVDSPLIDGDRKPEIFAH